MRSTDSNASFSFRVSRFNFGTPKTIKLSARTFCGRSGLSRSGRFDLWLSLSIRLFLIFNHIAASWLGSQAKTVWSHESPLHVVAFKTSENSTIAIWRVKHASPSLLLVLPLTKPEKLSICWSRPWSILRRWVNSGPRGADSGEEIGTQYTSSYQERRPPNS